MRRLLILACSQRKNPDGCVLPALARYDGPTFRVLRKFLREAPEEAPVVLIISAKYGLINSTRMVHDYDLQLSASRADHLRPAVLKRLRRVLRSGRWESIGLCVGKRYAAALEGAESILPREAKVEVLNGGLGRRLTSLRRWLRCEGPPSSRTVSH
jgi:Family of unknown function (DUF6884)